MSRLLIVSPSLVNTHLLQGATRQRANDHYLDEIAQYVHAGDTAIHVAAAGYRPDFARDLMAAGAEVNSKNLTGAEELFGVTR